MKRKKRKRNLCFEQPKRNIKNEKKRKVLCGMETEEEGWTGRKEKNAKGLRNGRRRKKSET
jgi:hypothetical protein